jgi:hypothetical protein
MHGCCTLLYHDEGERKRDENEMGAELKGCELIRN